MTPPSLDELAAPVREALVMRGTPGTVEALDSLLTRAKEAEAKVADGPDRSVLVHRINILLNRERQQRELLAQAERDRDTYREALEGCQQCERSEPSHAMPTDPNQRARCLTCGEWCYAPPGSGCSGCLVREALHPNVQEFEGIGKMKRSGDPDALGWVPVCPTCGSDDSAVRLVLHAGDARAGCPDPFHSDTEEGK